LAGVQRTPHSQTVLGGYVGVDHRRLQIHMSQQLLDGPDVMAVLQQMGGERMAQCVYCARLDSPASFDARLTAFCSTLD